MAQQFVSSSAASIPAVNGGVSLSMGASTGLLKARAPQTPDLGVHGSVVVEGNETAKSVLLGTFAHSHKLPLSFFMTDELAGQPSSALRSPQNPNAWFTQSAIAFAHIRKTSTSFRNGDFNIFTGKFTTPPTVVKQCMYSINTAVDSCVANVADQSTNVSAAVPGKLTFMIGSPNPSTVNYKPSTSR